MNVGNTCSTHTQPTAQYTHAPHTHTQCTYTYTLTHTPQYTAAPGCIRQDEQTHTHTYTHTHTHTPLDLSPPCALLVNTLKNKKYPVMQLYCVFRHEETPLTWVTNLGAPPNSNDKFRSTPLSNHLRFFGEHSQKWKNILSCSYMVFLLPLIDLSTPCTLLVKTL